MKKVICVLFVALLALCTCTAVFAMDKEELNQWLAEQIEIQAQREKQDYYSLFEEDIINKYGEDYNKIYKQGWFDAYDYVKEKNDGQLQSADEQARNERLLIWGQSDGKIDGYKAGYTAGLNIFSKAKKASEQDYNYQQSDKYYQKGYSDRFKEFFETGDRKSVV